MIFKVNMPDTKSFLLSVSKNKINYILDLLQFKLEACSDTDATSTSFAPITSGPAAMAIFHPETSLSDTPEETSNWSEEQETAASATTSSAPTASGTKSMTPLSPYRTLSDTSGKTSNCAEER